MANVTERTECRELVEVELEAALGGFKFAVGNVTVPNRDPDVIPHLSVGGATEAAIAVLGRFFLVGIAG